MIDQIYSCLDNEIFASSGGMPSQSPAWNSNEDLARARAGNSTSLRCDAGSEAMQQDSTRLDDSLDHTSQLPVRLAARAKKFVLASYLATVGTCTGIN